MKKISKESVTTGMIAFAIVCTSVLVITGNVECNRLEVENTELKTKNAQLESYIDELEQELATETVELDNCPKCKSAVELKQTMDFFHIKCSGCGLGTKSYESKTELVEYWNKE